MPEYRIMEVGPQGGRYNERRVFAPSASEALAIVREKTNGSIRPGRAVYVLGKVEVYADSQRLPRRTRNCQS